MTFPILEKLNGMTPAALSAHVLELYEGVSAVKRENARAVHENAVALARLHWLGMAQPTSKARNALTGLALFLMA